MKSSRRWIETAIASRGRQKSTGINWRHSRQRDTLPGRAARRANKNERNKWGIRQRLSSYSRIRSTSEPLRKCSRLDSGTPAPTERWSFFCRPPPSLSFYFFFSLSLFLFLSRALPHYLTEAIFFASALHPPFSWLFLLVGHLFIGLPSIASLRP